LIEGVLNLTKNYEKDNVGSSRHINNTSLHKEKKNSNTLTPNKRSYFSTNYFPEKKVTYVPEYTDTSIRNKKQTPEKRIRNHSLAVNREPDVELKVALS